MAEDAAGKTGDRTARGRRVRRITSTELAKRLSDVLNRVHYRGETVLVERGGKPLCQLTPALGDPDLQLSELVDLLGSLQSVGDEWAQAVAEGVAEQDIFEGFEWPR